MSCFIRDVVRFKTAFENEELLKPLFSHDKGETIVFLLASPKKLTSTAKENSYCISFSPDG
ncbi:hypothetical protein EAN84_15950 [Salmonella enterica]|nr:hypothetical protein [Salmonella enterica]EBS4440654.1 hypothetical protein [Salmonella enterica subsp. enterica serovar Guinea]EAS8074381.1 hypothetical protein [Salmonella enterica]EAU7381413.1 hypothetical protein [Salmonella enterica]EBK5839018.1 hypothetical protein [Salmonella enterica]